MAVANHARSGSSVVNGEQDTPYDSLDPCEGPSSARGSALPPQQERRASRGVRTRRESRSSNNVSLPRRQITTSASARSPVSHPTQSGITVPVGLSQSLSLSASGTSQYREPSTNTDPARNMHTGIPFSIPTHHSFRHLGPSGDGLSSNPYSSALATQQTFSDMPPSQIPAHGSPYTHSLTEPDLPTLQSSSRQQYIPQEQTDPSIYNISDLFLSQEIPDLPTGFSGYPQNSSAFGNGPVSNAQDWTLDFDQ